MLVLRLIAVGILSGGLAVHSERAGGGPVGNVVVQAVHKSWPDGSPVESGGLHYPTDIYAVAPSGRPVRNVTHDAPTSYLVGRLPGGRILFESVPSDRMRTGRPAIFSVQADGSGRRLLAFGRGAQLAPDGRRVLFAQGRWLYVVRTDGTGRTRLAQTSFGYYVPPQWDAEGYDGSWSADGQRIVFVRGFAEHEAYGGPFHPRSALFVVNADGTGLRRLTKVRPKVETMNPSWSPDGRTIAYEEHSYTTVTTADRTYVMRADGTGVKRLKQLEGALWFWLPNGRIALRETPRGKSIAADGTGGARPVPARVRVGDELWITSGKESGLWPVSPDGKWIAVVSDMNSLWIERLDGTHRRLVTRAVCCFWSTWSVGWAGP